MICGRESDGDPVYRRDEESPIGYIAACKLCGEYRYFDFDDMRRAMPTDGSWHYLSCATRQAWESGVRQLVGPETINELISNHRKTSVSENLDRLIQFLGKKLRRPSDTFRVNFDTDFTVIDVEGPPDLRVYLEWLRNDHLVNLSGPHSAFFDVGLLRDGWARLQPTPQKGGIAGTCFIAMWFDPSLGDAYSLGIEPAVRDCGFKAIRIDRKEHNNQITDEIMAEIRNAEFLVADFTGHRAGVYYEAGFARGLGREVIYCCREESFKERHFDTSVINHIVWSNEADLRKKLTDRIRATIISKA